LTAESSSTVKRWLKRVTPDRVQIREHERLRIFGELLHDPNLWHLNRHSVLGYFTVQALWRWNLVRQIRLRRARYRNLSSAVRTPSSKSQT
jgi:hypothetical protein